MKSVEQKDSGLKGVLKKAVPVVVAGTLVAGGIEVAVENAKSEQPYGKPIKLETPQIEAGLKEVLTVSPGTPIAENQGRYEVVATPILRTAKFEPNLESEGKIVVRHRPQIGPEDGVLVIPEVIKTNMVIEVAGGGYSAINPSGENPGAKTAVINGREYNIGKWVLLKTPDGKDANLDGTPIDSNNKDQKPNYIAESFVTFLDVQENK